MTVLLFAMLSACIILSAFFSGSEMAYSCANRIRLENIGYTGNKKAKLALEIIDSYDSTLSAILIGNNLVNIAASSIGSVIIIILMGPSFTWISTMLVTLLIVVFGETIPKITAKRNATETALRNSGFISVLVTVFKPVIFIVVSLVNLICSAIKPESSETEESVEELQSIIETAEDEGIIDSNDSEILQNAIDFSDISASEVMTARVDVQAIDIDDSWSNIMQLVNSTPYSRIPVYKDSIDNIIGVLHLNRLLTVLSNNNAVQTDISRILMKPCFVYKTMKLPKVLSILRSAKQHLAIVTDEYSGTLGVISMEDVLEQLVGEIWDETDPVEKDDVVEKQSGVFEIDGDLPISEFPALVGLNEDEFDAKSETVGGWVIERMEHFPQSGESFTFKDYTVTVLDADTHRVTRVLVRAK